MKFYTYVIKNGAGDVLYVGKGCGTRWHDSTLREGVAQESKLVITIQRHPSEEEALDHEARLIHQHWNSPSLLNCALPKMHGRLRKSKPLHPRLEGIPYPHARNFMFYSDLSLAREIERCIIDRDRKGARYAAMRLQDVGSESGTTGLGRMAEARRNWYASRLGSLL